MDAFNGRGSHFLMQTGSLFEDGILDTAIVKTYNSIGIRKMNLC